jgi:hypothetical protein
MAMGLRKVHSLLLKLLLEFAVECKNETWHRCKHFLTALVMNVAIFWDTAPCSQYMNQRFGGTYNLHLQRRKSA